MTRNTSLLHEEQVEKLMQIGAYLRHVREESLLSLEEVAARTMIQARLLKAIEAGKLHQLPEPVYIQGFIKRYAEALGLDGTEFADAFPTERQVQAAQVATWKDSPAAQLRPLHLYIAYIVLIMASVSLLSFLMGRSAPSSSAISSVPATGEVTPIQGSTAQRPVNGKKSNTGIKTPATAGFAPAESAIARRPDRLVEPGKPVQIDVKLTAQSWLEVEVDGDVKLAEVLPEGTERSWAASNRLRVRAGNAGGVLLAYNGGKAEQMGAPGAVEEKTFTLSQDANQDSSQDSSQNSGGSSKPATAPAQR
jgi:cytoskeletal protein RodZ